jgi:ribosome biogenesis GTPase / thiamine phosphate phosphatase
LESTNKIIEGLVTKSTGTWYQVLDDDKKTWTCRIKGKFKTQGLKLTNPVTVGDRVCFVQESGQETAMITKILPRRNYIARQSPSRKYALHLLASNVDQAIVIVTIREPNVKIGFIDRFLLMTEPSDIPTIIVFNKVDVYDEDDMEYLNEIKAIYEAIGYETLCVSATENIGLQQFIDILKDKTTLVAGHSGVGKSTLVNAIQPQLDIRTMEISDYSGKGQHTTTFSEIHPLSFGGYIIDTPGIKELAFIEITPEIVAHNFREIFVASAECKYDNCKHLNEPSCAVKTAVANGKISETRYTSYINILTDVQELNTWERHGGA